MTDNKTNQRYQTIILYREKIITADMAAKNLGITPRHFFRILDAFEKSRNSIDSLRYHSHPAWNRTNEQTENLILDLAHQNPQALNTHLAWIAWNIHELEIAPDTIRNILIRNDRYVPFAQKENRAYTKFCATHFGALAQLDTSDGLWLEGWPRLYLVVAVDDATRTILGGRFFLADSTLNNMIVIKEIIKKWGIPALFYTDCDSKFKVIRHGNSRFQNYKQSVLEGEAVTEIRRALEEVGSGLLTCAPFYPQAKGKIEKLFQFIQDCFVAHHTAKTLEELNSQLQRWISWYDSRRHKGLGIFPRQARDILIAQEKSAFKNLAPSADLDKIFSVRDFRKPNKYNIFHYQGKEYQLPLERALYPGKVELRIMPDNAIKVFDSNQNLIAELQQ